MCAIGAALAVGPARAQAPIVTDGTMGARVELNGPAMQIPHTLGTQSGANLFHSFQRFNIPTRSSATFTGPGGIDNVISRVTGGEASTIDGAFRSTIPGAAVWLINPAGVTFGPNASLDVPASFHASTADEIRFPDGGRFSADLGATSKLSVAPPEAFGFLRSNPAPLRVERSQLSVRKDATLSLAAGGIDIQGNAPTPNFDLPEFVDITGGTLRAPSGTINLASVAGPAEVKTDGTLSGNNHGAIRLTNGALINASGDGAGVVRIRGGEVTSTGSYVLASNTGSVAGAGGIDISADRLSLQDDGRSPSLVAANAHNAGDAPPINVRTQDLNIQNAMIDSSTVGSGKAGDIRIDASNQLTLDHFGLISAESLGSGAGGEITVNAGYLLIRDQSEINSLTRGPAPAGNITVTARTLLIDSALSTGEQPPTGIFSSAESGSGGNAGAVSVRANDVTLNGFYANIDSSTWGSGKAGDIRIDASNQMTLDAGLISAESLGSGAGGDITVNAGYLLIRDQSEINSFTKGPEPAGNITVTARTLLVDGPDGATGIFSTADPESGGNAGTVSVRANDVTLNGFYANIDSSTFGSGEAGHIRIDASNQMTLDHAGQVTALSSGSGAGGDITVNAGYLLIRDQSQISSRTTGPAPAGNINVTARTLLIDSGLAAGEQPSSFTGISSNADPGSGGNAGTVSVRANDVTLNGFYAEIDSSTFGSGKAGNIQIDASNQLTLDNLAGVFASSLSLDPRGAGGNITVNAGNLVIRGQSQISSRTRGPAPAGNITVTAGTLLADGPSPVQQPITGITASAQSELNGQTTTPGNAGDVIISAHEIHLTNGAQITSYTQGPNDAGTITLIVPGTLTIERGSEISSSSYAKGNAGTIVVIADKVTLSRSNISTTATKAGGGRISIRAGKLLYLKDSEITTDVFGGPETTAGNINIDPQFVIMNNSKISAHARQGRGGNILISADNSFLSESVIDASSESGISGTVNISGDVTNITGGLTPLPGKLMDAAGQMQVRCAARGSVEGSSFTIAGPEAQSPALEGYLAGTYAAGADETAATGDSLMIAPGGLAPQAWIIACGEAR